MMLLDRLMAGLKPAEALRLFPYDDKTGKRVGTLPSGGKLTLGWGHNLSDRGITEVLAQQLLIADVLETVQDIRKAFPWWEGLDDVRQEVIADICFNMGTTKVKGFPTFVWQMESGAFQAAARNMETWIWYKQVGRRAVRLVKMMRTGQYVEPLKQARRKSRAKRKKA